MDHFSYQDGVHMTAEGVDLRTVAAEFGARYIHARR